MTRLTKLEEGTIAKALEARERDLRVDLRNALVEGGESRYAELAGMVHDQGEESVADMLSDVSDALVTRHAHELDEIRSARKRLADGLLNHCVDCDGDIPIRRLQAYPMAQRCVACQSQYEKTHKHENTPRL